MTLAIDFDGVIHDPANKEPGYKMGKPIPDAQVVMKLMHQRGITLIVHTLWALTPAGQAACEKWLDYFEIPYHEVTALKPKADLYIDDRGYAFTSWRAALPVIDNLVK